MSSDPHIVQLRYDYIFFFLDTFGYYLLEFHQLEQKEKKVW